MGTVSLLIGLSSDPLTVVVARVLTIPLRELTRYFGAGIVEIEDSSEAASSEAAASRWPSRRDIAAAARVAAIADPRAWTQPTGPSGVFPSS